MTELTDSGLSRNELLHDMPNIGVPLKDDAFFQLVRSSRTVREMLINPNEEFSADRVIEKALRQDLGADKSQSVRKQNYKLAQYDEATAPNWEYKKKYRDKDPLYDPEAQYAGHNVIGRSQRMFAFETEKPATFINRPLTRGQLRKRFMRSVQKDELDWKNTPLMTKFINDSGKLYNRYQSRLETPVHRRVAEVIKKMRHLGILPWVGIVKPTDKIPIGSYIEDIEEMHRKTIDPVTGRLFLKHSLTDDMRERHKRVHDSYERKFKDVEGAKDFEANNEGTYEKATNRLIREMAIDVDRMYPNRQ